MRKGLQNSVAKWCFAVGIVMMIVSGVLLAIALASHDGRAATIFRICCFAIGASAFGAIGGYKESQSRMSSHRE